MLSLALAATVAVGGPDLIFEDSFGCGTFIVFCDDFTDVDNFSQIVDTARLGHVFNLGVGSGSIYLDDFRSFRITAPPR